MKLKMAKNSLFAVLLRSPWWISFALVLVVGLATKALLPPQYVVFGLMGAIPFLVIGLIAAYRQLRAPSAQRVEQTLQRAAAMGWNDFSGALEQSYRKQDYAVQRLAHGGADMVLTKGARSTLVSCKRWKATNHGAAPLRALDQARQERDASQSIYITLAEPNDNTRRFAQQHQIELLHGVALAQLLGKLPDK